MQNYPVPSGLIFTAALAALSLALSGCAGTPATPAKAPTTPAATSASSGFSPGIGGPGGGSADTRSAGTIASSEGEGTLMSEGAGSPVADAGGHGR